MTRLAHVHLYHRIGRLLVFLFLPVVGYLQAYALASPTDGSTTWWLQVLALAGFFLTLDASRTVWSAARRAWWFATCWLVSVFWWLYISMHVYAGLNLAMTVLAIVALAAFLGLYYAVAGALYWKMRVRGYWGSAMMFGACWTLAELARGQWLTGFPWGAIGYAHVDGPLAWLARYVGVCGVGYVAAFLSVLMAFSIISIIAYIFGRFISVARLPLSGIRVASAFVWLGAVAAALWWGQSWQQRQFDQFDARLHQQPHLSVTLALLQGNIPQEEKFMPGKGIPDALSWYGQQLLTSEAQLVIAPETAIPLLKTDLPPGYWRRIEGHFRQGAGQAMLTGIPLGNFEDGYTNSVVGVQPGNADYVYSKSHLVPFGEFIPPLFRWFTDLMNIPLGDFDRGTLAQPSFQWRGERFAPNICYEDLFGEELARRFAPPAEAPTVLVNFSNIGWFGDGVAIDQHLHISRMRTLELERPMVRATNTGATAVIDHRGVVQAMAPRATRHVLHASVTGVGQDGHPDSITPFARWSSAFGLLPAWLATLTLLVIAGMFWKRVTQY